MKSRKTKKNKPRKSKKTKKVNSKKKIKGGKPCRTNDDCRINDEPAICLLAKGECYEENQQNDNQKQNDYQQSQYNNSIIPKPIIPNPYEQNINRIYNQYQQSLQDNINYNNTGHFGTSNYLRPNKPEVWQQGGCNYNIQCKENTICKNKKCVQKPPLKIEFI